MYISCRIFQSSYKFYKHEVPTKARNNRTGKSAVTGTNNSNTVIQAHSMKYWMKQNSNTGSIG